MAKHASVLRQFTVETVQYDGWMQLAHHWRECDWTADIDGDRITDLMRQATAHAKVCDGKPQPRPEPQPDAYRNSYMTALWANQIKAALEAHLIMPGPVQPAEKLPRVVHVDSFAEIDRLLGEDPDDRAIREAHGFSYDDDWQDRSLLCRNGCGLSYPDIAAGKIRECSGATDAASGCPCGHGPDDICLNGAIYGNCGDENCGGGCDPDAGTCRSLPGCCDVALCVSAPRTASPVA